jgi:hypothetical protein
MLPTLTLILVTVDAQLPRAGSSAFQATQQGIDNAINSQSFQVVES